MRLADRGDLGAVLGVRVGIFSGTWTVADTDYHRRSTRSWPSRRVLGLGYRVTHMQSSYRWARRACPPSHRPVSGEAPQRRSRRPACLSGDASGQGSCLASSATRRRGRSAGRADVAVDWLPRDAAAQPTPQASAAIRGRLAASPSWRNRPRCTTAPHAPGKRPHTCSSRRSSRQRDACLSRSASKHLAPRQHAPRRRPT